MQHHRRVILTSVKLIFSPENIFSRASSTPLDRAWNITHSGYFYLSPTSTTTSCSSCRDEELRFYDQHFSYLNKPLEFGAVFELEVDQSRFRGIRPSDVEVDTSAADVHTRLSADNCWLTQLCRTKEDFTPLAFKAECRNVPGWILSATRRRRTARRSGAMLLKSA